MRGYTWAVDGYGRCFVVRLSNLYDVIYCAFSPGGATAYILDQPKAETMLDRIAESYNAEIIETDNEVKVRLPGKSRFKTFVGCDRESLAAKYIREAF